MLSVLWLKDYDDADDDDDMGCIPAILIMFIGNHTFFWSIMKMTLIRIAPNSNQMYRYVNVYTQLPSSTLTATTLFSAVGEGAAAPPPAS